MNRSLRGSVTLPGSKSESNRVLMIAAYSGFQIVPANLSEAHDTVLLRQLLQQIALATPDKAAVVDCEDAGTVARFLLTYLACREGEWVVTGTERMCQRPMKPLVDALLQLGANIEYLGVEGFLPVRVKGRALEGGSLTIDASQSSQFVSSLLLAAPCWSRGLQLRLEGRRASASYIGMSMALMRHFGASVRQEAETIVVDPRPYVPSTYEVAMDWSAASYWYETAALSEECHLLLKGLRSDSLQGDRKAVEIFEQLGVATRFDEEGAWIEKPKNSRIEMDQLLCFDFSDTPDLFPAVFVTCVALHSPAVFKGIQNLAIKESNRIKSIIFELSKIYTFINRFDDDSIVIRKSDIIYNTTYNNKLVFATYLDHRIAMALAPLSLLFPGLSLDHPEVVAKSYPNFINIFCKMCKNM